MKVWLVTCVMLFIVAQFISWAKQFLLPLPVAILAGAFLAIASNYEKGIFAMFKGENQLFAEPTSIVSQTATIVEEMPLLEGNSPQEIEGVKEES